MIQSVNNLLISYQLRSQSPKKSLLPKMTYLHTEAEIHQIDSSYPLLGREGLKGRRLLAEVAGRTNNENFAMRKGVSLLPRPRMRVSSAFLNNDASLPLRRHENHKANDRISHIT